MLASQSPSCFSVNSTSMTGTCTYYRGALIGWRCKRQTVRAYSTCEAESVACSDAIGFAVNSGLENFYNDKPGVPLQIFTDSTSALHLIKGVGTPSRSRHFALRVLRSRDHQTRFHYTRTGRMKADCLTKINTPSSIRRMVFYPLEVGSDDKNSVASTMLIWI